MKCRSAVKPIALWARMRCGRAHGANGRALKFAAVQAATQNVGGEAVITVGSDMISLQGLTKAQLRAVDFRFV